MSLIMRSILKSMICTTFEAVCGKWQSKKPVPQAFKFTFRLQTNHEVEEGYRYLDVLIYGASNYVQVYCREQSNVISLDDMEESDPEDQTGEMVPKEGKGYVKTTKPWEKVADHDSCWREGIEKILKTYKPRITALDSPLSTMPWWDLVLPQDEGIS
jgi:hypothetical protein